MIPGSQSDIVDTQLALKKVLGKVLTNTKTFPAQEPVSQMQLSSVSIWMDDLPDAAQLPDYETQLWNYFNDDITNNGAPKRYYEVSDNTYPVKQILVFCEVNPGTEDYSFDILDNNLKRVDKIITTSFGNHFQPKLWKWNGSSIVKQVSPISGVYWQVDAGGYLYTADKGDPDYSSNGYYLIAYRYTGTVLKNWNGNGGTPQPSGGWVSSGTDHYREVLSVPKTTFTLPYRPNPNSVVMAINGVRQYNGIDYTVTNNTVTWLNTDFQLESGDYIEIDYQINNAENASPIILSTPPTSIAAGSNYYYQLFVYKPDVTESLTYSIPNNAGFLSVNSSGVVSGIPNGTHIGNKTATVRATDSKGNYSEQTWSFQVWPSVTGAFMVNDFDNLTHPEWVVEDGSNAAIVTDPTIPSGSTSCLEITFPSGMPDNSAPAVLSSSVRGLNSVYIGFYLYVDNLRDRHPKGQKLVRLSNYDSKDTFYLTLTANDHLEIQAYPTWHKAQTYSNNAAAYILPHNTWNWIEIYASAGDAGNSSDQVKVWINGTLTHDYSNISITGPQSQERWGVFAIDPIYGEFMQFQNAVTWVIRFDHIVFSTQPINQPQ
jgi:hypothetical protein